MYIPRAAAGIVIALAAIIVGTTLFIQNNASTYAPGFLAGGGAMLAVCVINAHNFLNAYRQQPASYAMYAIAPRQSLQHILDSHPCQRLTSHGVFQGQYQHLGESLPEPELRAWRDADAQRLAPTHPKVAREAIQLLYSES